ncbi:MAG: signal peptide peptidase SppA [Bacteroidales bacterium]|nr:signal peptide peptidase SppA [Bacteroidales bacterium]
MKDFFKFMFASMLGFFFTSVIVFFLFFAFLMAMISFTKSDDIQISDDSILHLKLDYEIEDRSSNDPFNYFYGFDSFRGNPGLNEITKNIEKATDDDRIHGIYLDLLDVPSGLATINEIRNVIVSFKESGKFVYVYGDILSQKAYYLATVADKIYLNPEGMLEFKGFYSEIVFIKGLLEKLEIDPQIIRHGKYKSAVEPLILDKMSEANREQTSAFVQSLWDETIANISNDRNISKDKLNDIANKLEAFRAENALEFNLIDSVIYYDEFLNILATHIETDHINSDNLLTISAYDKIKARVPKKKRSRDKVAIVYASGDISQGEGSDNTIGADKIARALRQARLDNSIKAVVLRVNSPGGDGLASDIILREANLIKAEKPIVVSMGNLAASGGYYIACGADKIVANANTITGSIGVFGLIPNFQQFFNNKLGVTFDNVKTNDNADFVQVTKPLSEFQYQLIEQEVDKFYNTFINHVAKGRNMTIEQVDEIAQGRVWSGADALKLGLVDELGDLNAAIELAAQLANIEDYRVIEKPEQKDPFEKIISELLSETRQSNLEKELGKGYYYLKEFKEVYEMKGIQARMPFSIQIN